MLGETIAGRYAVVRLLGEGGMGSVYEAKHLGTGRRVALKVITGDLTKHPVLVARFGREARAAGAIESQHIAQVLDAGEDEGRPFLVMEFLEGEDLQQLFTRIGPLPPDLAVRIVAQACTGLAKAHANGIVHRDLKPGNIFLAERDGGERVAKLLDFGIAKLKLEEAENKSAAGLTNTGALIGTPLYMSPEQARGDKSIDLRTDIWSLGVVLYAALTGHTPHDEIDAIGALIIAICGGRGRPVHEIAPWVSPEIVAVVDKALAIDPNDRFQTADEMHKALRALTRGGTSIEAESLVPLTQAERAALTALPGTQRSGDVPASPPRASDPPRGPSEPAIVLAPPGAGAGRSRAQGSTLASSDTIDVVASTERSTPSNAPGGASAAHTTTGATSSSTLAEVVPARRARRAPLALGGVAVLGLAAFAIARFAASPVAPAPGARAAQTMEAAPPASIDPARTAVVVTPSVSIVGPPPASSAAASASGATAAAAAASLRVPPRALPKPVLPADPPKAPAPTAKPYDPTKQM